jgi:hypothetical protein
MQESLWVFCSSTGHWHSIGVCRTIAMRGDEKPEDAKPSHLLFLSAEDERRSDRLKSQRYGDGF